MRQYYQSVEVVGLMGTPYSMPFEHRNIYLARGRKANLLSDWPRSEERRVGKECRSRRAPEYSSRRRHTRCLSDWSSDVCSSDLGTPYSMPFEHRNIYLARGRKANLLSDWP